MPAVIYLHGYASDMMATKAQYLDRACAARDQSYLRFDYSGNGLSDGEFGDGTIGRWLEDALAIIDRVTPEDFILVGSSMGGWIGLECALKRPQRIKAFIGIAAAPDFTDDIWHRRMTDAQRVACEKTGYHETDDAHPLKIYYEFLREGGNHLLLKSLINLAIPVVLLQGKLDREVPWQTAVRIQELVTPAKAETVFIEDGDHRLARPQDMEILDGIIRRLNVAAWE
jgi:pimeloyl-ACP methyl ester carboxylesterase